MKRKKIASALVFAVMGLSFAVAGGCARRINLVGTWKLSAMKVDGQVRSTPQLYDTYKHITSEGFVWLSKEKDSGRIIRAAGGTYQLKGKTYTEKIEYGIGKDYEVIKNSRASFTARIDHDTWYHVGTLQNGQTIDEVWVRVKGGR
jgi:hypothetical protein